MGFCIAILQWIFHVPMLLCKQWHFDELGTIQSSETIHFWPWLWNPPHFSKHNSQVPGEACCWRAISCCRLRRLGTKPLNVNKGDMQRPGRTNMDQSPVYGDIMGIQVRISWNAHIALYNDNNTITIICIFKFILIYVLLQATNINQLYCWVGWSEMGYWPLQKMLMRIW